MLNASSARYVGNSESDVLKPTFPGTALPGAEKATSFSIVATIELLGSISFELEQTSCEDGDVRPTLREILADSHISAIAIVVLLLWSTISVFRASFWPSIRIAEYLFTAVAIRGIPFAGPFSVVAERLMLLGRVGYLFNAFANSSAAWLLARWVYGEGPLRCLSRYRPRVSRRGNA